MSIQFTPIHNIEVGKNYNIIKLFSKFHEFNYNPCIYYRGKSFSTVPLETIEKIIVLGTLVKKDKISKYIYKIYFQNNNEVKEYKLSNLLTDMFLESIIMC